MKKQKGRYDVIKRTSTNGSEKEKWFWTRRSGGRFPTVAEAVKEANRKNKQSGA